MYSYGPPLMAEPKQDDQLEHTYSSSVRIRDIALKTCQRRWTIGRGDERGSRISVLAARHDDDDIYIYIYNFEKVIFYGCKEFEAQRIEHSSLKRTLRKKNLTSVPGTFQPEHVCNICSSVCLSTVELASHMRSHDNKQSLAHFIQVLLQQRYKKLVFPETKYVGLQQVWNHMRMHGDSINDRVILSHIWQGWT